MQAALDAAPPLSRRLLDTLFAPRRLARELPDTAPWFDALMIATLVAMLAGAALPADFFLDQMAEPVNRRGAPVTITSPPGDIVLYGRMMQMLSAMLGHPVVVFALAGAMALLFRVIARGRADFRQHLALAAHASIIFALGSLAAGLWQTLAGGELSLGLLLPRGAGGWAAAVMAAVNPFTLWMLAVLGIGAAALDRRPSPLPSVAALVGVYLAIAALVAALGARGA